MNKNVFFILYLIVLTVISCAPKISKTTNSNNGKSNELSVYKDVEVTAFYKRTKGVVAMDGGYSIPLLDGRVLWLFGDSYIDHYDSATKTVPCLFQVRNCALLQPANHSWQWQQTQTLLSTGEGSKSYLKNKPDGTYFMWPGAGVQVKDTVYILCLSLKNVPGGLGFDSAGPPLLAKIKFPEMRVAGFTELSQDFNGVGFGQGFIKDEAAGYVYVYGSKSSGLFTNNIYAGRFPIDTPSANWQFWDGGSWNNDAQKIAPIGSVPAFSTHVSKVKDKYLLLSADFSLGCDQGKNIYASTSNSPTGPFSEKKLIYTIADTVQGHYPFFYLPIAHPEFINAKDELLINYSINGYGTCIEGCINGKFNPEFYRPQAIRVPLKFIDPEW